MNQDEVKKASVQKKPLRTFGEDEPVIHHGKPVIHSTSNPDKLSTGTTKKVDRAIHKTGSAPTEASKKAAAPQKKSAASGSKSSAASKNTKLRKNAKASKAKKPQQNFKHRIKLAISWFDRFVAGDADITLPTIGKVFRWIFDRFAWMGKFGFAGFILGSVILMILMLTFFNNTSIAVENVTVSIAGLNSDLEGYTICLISDLHGRKFGTEQATLLRAINGEEYDMMLITGDMVGTGDDPQPFYDLLDGLDGNQPVYFIAGDSDPGPLREYPNITEGTLEEYVLEEWVLGAIERGAIYIDSPESLKVDDAIIWLTPESMLNVDSSATLSALNKQVYQETNEVLAGLDIGYRMLPFSSYRQQNMTELQDRILEMNPGDLHISLSHIPPASAPRISDGSDGFLPTVDLLVAGHYCGGVWQLPFLGALYIPSVEAPRHGWFPEQSDVEGLRYLGSTNMYVSGGLGVTDQIYLPNFRFGNQPKVTLLHLTAKLTDDLLGLTD